MPYIVGSNPNSPSNPHSAPASGGNNIQNIDGDPPKEAYVLYGAVIGGPDKHDKYYDIRSDWPQTEVDMFLLASILDFTKHTGGSGLQRPNADTYCDARFE